VVEYANIDKSGNYQIVVLSWPSLDVIDLYNIDFMSLDLLKRGDTLLASAVVPSLDIDLARLRSPLGAEVAGHIPRRDLRNPIFIDANRIGFVVRELSGDVWFRNSKGIASPVTNDGQSWSASADNSGQILVSRVNGRRQSIYLYRAAGESPRELTDGPNDIGPAFLPGGDDWVFMRLGSDAGIYKCSLLRGTCARLTQETSLSLSVDPAHGRIAYTVWADALRPPRVKWISPDGGETHDISPSETGCAPVWMSASRIWISRRRQGRPVWVAMNPDTRQETGNVIPGR